MSDQLATPPLPETPAQEAADERARTPRKKWPWVAGAVGIVIVAAAIIIPVSISSAQRAADDEAAAAAATAEEERLAAFDTAVFRCAVRGLSTVRVLDGGESLELERVTKRDGMSYDDLTCVLNQLGAPESVEAAIGQTRALDGRQSDTWDGYEASWTYHPDDGASILIQHAD